LGRKGENITLWSCEKDPRWSRRKRSVRLKAGSVGARKGKFPTKRIL